MTTENVKCYETLTYNEDTLECRNCQNKVHFYCIGVTETSFKKMSKNSNSRLTYQTYLGPATKSTNETSNKFEKMEELFKSVTCMGLHFDEFNKKMEAALLEMNPLRTENEKIKTENIRLTNKIVEIKQKHDKI